MAKNSSDKISKLSLYARLPEMRFFWLLLPFFVVLMAINVLYVNRLWIVIASAAVFVFILVITFLNNIRLARTNLQVKLEKNQLQSIIGNLRDGIIAYDPDFNILVFNRAAENILRIKSDKVLNTRLSPEKAQVPELRLVSQVMFPSLAPIVIRRSETGVYPQVADLTFSEPVLELRVATDRVTDPTGNLLGFVKVVHDRTREQELLRSKTEFIGVAAHQLRTPLTAVNWSLENLSKQEMKNDEQKQVVETALQASAKLLKTVNDLLDITKIEEGRFGYKFEEIGVAEFLEKTLADVKSEAEKAGIKLYFNRPNEEIRVSADPQKLSMAVFNFLDNAIRYNVQNGEVTVTLEKLSDKPYAVISVKDTGIGIPPEAMEKLFTRFYRAENAERLAPDGSGLGIYIAKNIIKRHGGEVWAESEINRGTTFYFTLPTDPSLIPPTEIFSGEE